MIVNKVLHCIASLTGADTNPHRRAPRNTLKIIKKNL